MHRNSSRPPATGDSAARKEAAAWVARHDRGLTADEVHDFAAWAEADPRHMEAYEQTAAAWRGLDAAQFDPALTTRAEAVAHRAARRRQRQRWLRRATALGAAAALVMLLAPRLDFGNRSDNATAAVAPQPSYQVLVSTAHQEILPDGSTAEINGASRIAVAYSATERRVHLLEGEVHFAVQKNPDRPFIVQVGNVAVRAVGTAFNVKRAEAGVEVLVTEGQVSVDDAVHGDSLLTPNMPVLQAGQKLVVGTTSATAPVPPVQLFNLGNGDIDQELSWQSTRLVFNDTPLGDVVSAFNRYNDVQLRIGAPELRDRPLTGVFKAENLDGFLRLLQAGQVVLVHPGVPGTKILMPAP
ncbi:MAG: FecR domain-containing protein [Opitutaceae bacterium]|nr:FecR domain-containing protein [Opitutaceae bacterium]